MDTNADMPRKKRGMTVALVACLAVLGGLIGAHIIRVADRGVLGAEKIPVKVNGDPSPVSLAEFRNGFASVITPALTSVVNISSTKVVKRQNQPMFNDPFFRQFFGDQFGQGPGGDNATPRTEREQSLGSGVIINSNGYILTNNHVISGASDVEVQTSDEKKYKGKVVGTDPQTDVAVVKIEASGLPAFTLGDSSGLKVGDVVFAIGNPFGIGKTATMGIVSATGRSLNGAIESYEDFIQTDASINPGNSGGALIDLHGNLIGINTAILSGQGGGNEGVGFAIPVNMARNVMDQIVEHGKVIRGQLGVIVQPVDSDMAHALGLPQGGGALIGDVLPNSPASKGGVQRGDVVTELNGKPVKSSTDLRLRISQTAPGTTVHLKVFRDAQTHDLDVTLSELTEKSAATPGGEESEGSTMKGLKVDNLTSDIANQLNLPLSTKGVVVESVDESSNAAAAGLQRGDVIQEVNRKPVNDVSEFQRATAGIGNHEVLLLVNRGGTTHYVVVQPQ